MDPEDRFVTFAGERCPVQLRELLRATLDADLRLVQSYRYAAGERLELPAQLFAAVDDREVSVEGVTAWRELFATRIPLRCFDGGHHYLDDAAAQGVVRSQPGPECTVRIAPSGGDREPIVFRVEGERTELDGRFRYRGRHEDVAGWIVDLERRQVQLVGEAT